MFIYPFGRTKKSWRGLAKRRSCCLFFFKLLYKTLNEFINVIIQLLLPKVNDMIKFI